MKRIYKKHKLSVLVNVTRLVSILYYEFSKDYRYEGESHDFWEMVYADKGSVIAYADGREIRLNQGEVYFHQPNEFHKLYADGKTAPNVVIISFVCQSPAMEFFKSAKMVFSAGERKLVSSIISECKTTFSHSGAGTEKNMLSLLDKCAIGGEQMIKMHLEELLITLIRSKSTPEQLPQYISEDNENAIVSNIIRILQEHTYKSVSMKEICGIAGYSKAYISKIFMQSTGYGVMECLNHLKIDEAKKLIREKKYNFSQISDMLCYDTPQYFTRVFKKFTNMTPTQYCQSVQIS